MTYIDPKIVTEVKELDLLTYLRCYNPQELVHIRGSTYCTRTHDSLKLSNGKWMWWSQGVGGRSALDYLIKVEGYTFTQAVEKILGKTGKSPPVFLPKKGEEGKKELTLPSKCQSADRVVRYLTGRGIDAKLINALIKTGQIYESLPYHNVVFVGFDEVGTARYASYRGTGGSRIMGDCEGSDKRFSFRLVCGEGSTVHVFESAIDLLSFATASGIDGMDYRQTNLLSLSGIYDSGKNSPYKLPVALDHLLQSCGQIRNVCLHLDNDSKGRRAAWGMRDALKEKYRVYDAPPPQGKDYNDFLLIKKGISRERKKKDEHTR